MSSDVVRVRVVYNHFPKITADLTRKAAAIVAKAAFDIAAAAQRNIRAHGLVDTGALVNSVQAHKISDLLWRVVVGAAYGIYHEAGTRFLPARPFLGPAADLVRPLFRAAMGGVVGR